ncbi:unnamed protein product, partial [Pocillopora meandrina]
KWIKRFERFRSASRLSKGDEESQLNTLLYSMRSKSDDILTTFGLTTDNSKKYDDEMIRDRIVVGLADQKLSEKFQLDADLTLEKAIKRVRQSESVRSQQSIVRGQDDASQPAEVDGVHIILKGKPTSTRYKVLIQSDVSNDVCQRCSLSPAHKRTQCPAKDA